jgi:hypothetical protein
LDPKGHTRVYPTLIGEPENLVKDRIAKYGNPLKK